eukprot:12291012-Ditylum_brightwellii.AAC.1
MEEVDDGLDALQNVLPDTHFIKNPAFSVPHIIPNYGVGAWRRDPPTQIRNQGLNMKNGKRDKTNSL